MTEDEVDEFTAVNSASPVRITEDGNVFTAVEALYTHSKTNAVVEYKIYKNHPYTDVKLTVEFAEKNKLMRVKIPIPEDMINGICVGDGPYVWEKKPEGCENSFQKWYGVMKNDTVYAVMNDGIYAGKCDGKYLYLTLLRGTGYCFHPIPDRPLYPTDRYLPRIECGRYEYTLRFIRGNVSEITRAAEEFSQRPYAVNIFPLGSGKRNDERIEVKGDVAVSAIKCGKADEYIIRLYNPKNTTVDFTVRIGDAEVSDTAEKRAIVSVGFTNGKFTVYKNKTPV